MLFPILQVPPQIEHPHLMPKPAWPGLDGFISNRIHPKSETDLLEALRNLYRDSQSVRSLLEEIWVEQRNLIIMLQLTNEQTFGDITIHTTSKGYLMTLKIQEIPKLENIDHIEPWLSTMLFMASETTKKTSAVEEDTGNYIFKEKTIDMMWKFQQQVRSELRKSNPTNYPNLNNNGPWIYWHSILRNP